MASRPRTPWVRDTALGAVLTVVAEAELLLLDPSQVEGSVAAHAATNLLIWPAVALRRSAPLLSTAVAAGAFAVGGAVGDLPVATPFLVLLFLLASLGWYADLRRGLVGVALVVLGGLGHDLVTGQVSWADAAVNVTIIVAAWGAVRLLRTATDSRVAAEVEAERRARDAVEAERTRIAQDLHDSLAHALTLMVLRAGSVRERTGEPLVAQALDAIEHSGREALADMHRFLGLLGPRDGEAPGIADLRALADGVDREALAVDLVVDTGLAERPVPQSVSTTVYRVVQEALTNVVRHSDARTARVRVTRESTGLVTVVTDDGGSRAARVHGSGRGLEGLRERLALFDGSLTAAATPTGWELRASIPLPEEP